MKLNKLELLKRFRKQILIKFDWEWYFLNNSEYHGGLGRELNYLANKAFDELLDAEIGRRQGKEIDALRWRDANKELPEPFVGVLSDSGDRVYITFDGVWIYDYWDRRDDGMEAVVVAWLPIPEWELID